MVKIQDT